MHVNHVLRMTNDMADLADELSRREVPKNGLFRAHIRKAEFFNTSNEFISLVSSPICQKPLYTELLKKIKERFS